MSLTDEEREKVDAIKRREIYLLNRAETFRIRDIAEEEFETQELQELSAEDRTAVDLVKLDLQAELDAKTREEELLAIALSELEE